MIQDSKLEEQVKGTLTDIDQAIEVVRRAIEDKEDIKADSMNMPLVLQILEQYYTDLRSKMATVRSLRYQSNNPQVAQVVDQV